MVALDEIMPSAASRSWARRSDWMRVSPNWRCARVSRVVRRKRRRTDHGDASRICLRKQRGRCLQRGWRQACGSAAAGSGSIGRGLRRELEETGGLDVAVIVSDSFGRPWREGLTEVAIGVAGMRPLVDYRGRRDSHGYSLHATV